ncbi:HNH endonuclease [Brachybacterium sp. YJGR34]|uniref:HNH endonuclease n=1 Tax=Brachybacterium sp. YJGR34 TaxID=2059911 RepID=UPI0013004EB4|nr:hypothetical protein [Brachybacterium sp. YJGR34]
MADEYLSLSGTQRRALLDQALAVYGWVCCICGLSISPGQESLQHTTARNRGGKRTAENERPAHKSCNYQLQDRDSSGPEGEIHNGLGYFAASRIER